MRAPHLLVETHKTRKDLIIIFDYDVEKRKCNICNNKCKLTLYQGLEKDIYSLYPVLFPLFCNGKGDKSTYCKICRHHIGNFEAVGLDKKLYHVMKNHCQGQSYMIAEISSVFYEHTSVPGKQLKMSTSWYSMLCNGMGNLYRWLFISVEKNSEFILESIDYDDLPSAQKKYFMEHSFKCILCGGDYESYPTDDIFYSHYNNCVKAC